LGGNFGPDAARHLQFAALDAFLPTDPPELPIYVRWQGEAPTESNWQTVEVDLTAAIRLQARTYGIGTPWRIRFVSRGNPANLAAWGIRFIDYPTPARPQAIDNPVLDPRLEAVDIVRWLDGTARPSAASVETVLAELNTIRYRSEDPGTELAWIRYFPPDGTLEVRFAPATANAVRLGTYTAWAGIGKVYYVGSLDAVAERFQIFTTNVLPRCAIVDAFAALPGVTGAVARRYEGRSRLFPFDVGGARSYLFRRSPETDPQGIDRYWYFEPEGTGHRLVGTWDAAPGSDPPAWWPNAQRNLDLFARWVADCTRGTP